MGGAQELFGVTPDLATFGKGVANGFPLAIVTGRRTYMSLMEDVFFSFTFGGETLSLAAAKAVIEKMRREPVLDTIHRRGQAVLDGVVRADRERTAWRRSAGLWSSRVELLHDHRCAAVQRDRAEDALPPGDVRARDPDHRDAQHVICALRRGRRAALLAAYDEVLPILRSAAMDRGPARSAPRRAAQATVQGP